MFNMFVFSGSVKKDTSSSLPVAAATTAAVGAVIVVALSGLCWTVRKRRKYIYNSDLISNPSTGTRDLINYHYEYSI